MNNHLRPIERRILKMRNEGLALEDIANRIGRSPEHVDRIVGWISVPRSGPAIRRSPRAMETRVLALRERGETHEQIGRRFHRSPGFIQRVEGLAHYTLARQLLS